jgi:RIO kinase 2
MQMSALAARKEYSFMKALWENGFPVPQPKGWNRHTVVMELVDAFPLRQIKSVPDPAGLYAELIDMILRLARVGLIHGDFNEFNILIKEEEIPVPKSTSTDPSEPPPSISTSDLQPSSTTPSDPQEPPPSNTRIKLTPILIDFPQTLSIDHANATYYLERDINCIKRFFSRRFHFTSNEPGPFFEDAVKALKSGVGKGKGKGQGEDAGRRLDVEVEASGFSRKMAKELEAYMREVGVDGDGGDGRRSGDEDGDEDAEEDEEGDSDGEGDEEEDGNEQPRGSGEVADDGQTAEWIGDLSIGAEAPTVETVR